MARGDNACSRCGRFAGKSHRCVTPSAPPPGATIPLSPKGETKPQPSTLPTPERLGGENGVGQMLTDVSDYREKLEQVEASQTSEEKIEALIRLEQEARRHAQTPDGYREVLQDAQRYLDDNNADRAALLSHAAAEGHQQPQQPPPPTGDPVASAGSELPPGPKQPYDSFPDRVEEAYVASDVLSEWEDYYQQMQAWANGAFEAHTCNPCRHAPHSRRCTCGCSAYTAPTDAQIQAYSAYLQYYQAYSNWKGKAALAREIRLGDRFRVVDGNSAPMGTEGYVLRVHEGRWGQRVLLHTPDGEDHWVSAKHLTRNSPEVLPGVGDPLP